MTPPDRKRILKAIQSALPHLCEKGRMLLVVPKGSILRGFYLEDSSTPDVAYLWAFVQPLYVPSVSVVFNLGKRLGGSCRTWKSGELDEIVGVAVQEGWPFLQQVRSSEDLAQWRVLAEGGEYRLQVRAYALGACGRWAEAVPLLHALSGYLAGATTGWRRELKEQAERLASLARSAPGDAAELLSSWQQETIKNLRLERTP